MRYSQYLYQQNDRYKVLQFGNRAEWLAGRIQGIGGSDAAAVVGQNPWKDNLTLWEEKTGRRQPEDISGKEAVIYGNEAEEPLRRLYKAKHRGEIEVNYMQNVTLQNREHPELLYSPDGLLVDGQGRKGILEIKTTTILRSRDKEKWAEQIPPNYFIQVLHGLNVTGFDFVDVLAELTFRPDYSQIREYHIEREDQEEALRYLQEEILSFWEKVKTDQEPALLLPII